MKISIGSVFLILAILFCSVPGKAQQNYFPPLAGNEWETASPESLGWCTDEIDSLYSFLEGSNTNAFLVLKDGKIVLEKYFGNTNGDSIWYWASAGKTLTAMLAGIAQEEGYLSIDSSTLKYLGPGWSSCPLQKETLIKVKNQISMTTGLDDMVADPDCPAPVCLQYAADAGSRWAYHNAPYTILDQVISTAAGFDFNSYFNTRIRNKIGMTGFWFYVDDNHVYFSTARSMARYGLLLLAKGSWEGNAVLADTSYFYAMTHSSQAMNKSYGYLTWLNGKESYMLPQSQYVFPGPLCPEAPMDMYAAMGKNGQLINVVPGQGLVVVRMGNAPDNQFDIASFYNNHIWHYLNKVICNPNGISEEVNLKGVFQIYPNPARSHIIIDPVKVSFGYNVFLYDLSGQLIVEAGAVRKLDVTDLSSGIYVLGIVQDGNMYRYRISIVH